MRDVKVGQVVRIDALEYNAGYYIVSPGMNLGKTKLVPIALDYSRKELKLTSQIKELLKPY